MSASRFLSRTLLASAALAVVIGASALRAQSQPLVGTLPVDVSVDNKGAANATIPLQIPAGRGGLQPKLALVYNSQAGNGPLGIGWSLSTGFPQSITRGRSILARDGVVRGVNFDANDKFYLDGKRLICVSGTYGQPGSTYRTEIDSFVTITATGSDSNIETFTVTDKAGVKMIFGKYAGSTDGYQPGTEYTNTLSGLAYAYAIKRVEDTSGNYLTFSYINPIAHEMPHLNRLGGEHLLSKIDYTGSAGVTPAVSIALDYADGRPDINYSYVGRRSHPISKRLNKIEVDQPVAAVSQITTRYTLVYDNTAAGESSRLIEVHPMVYQVGNPSLQSMSATTVRWADNAVNYTSIGLPVPYWSGYPLYGADYGDVDGDGRDDMITGSLVAKSTGIGFSAWENWAHHGAGGLGTSIQKVCDVNGDGLKDIVYVGVPYPNPANGGVYAQISDGSKFVCMNGEDAAPTSFYNVYEDFLDPITGDNYFISHEGDGIINRVCTADFNGDGLDDILIHRYDGKIKVLYSYGTGFHGAVEYNIGARSLYASWSFQVWSLMFLGYYVGYHPSISQAPCDLNGDGRADYVWTETMQNWMSTDSNTGSAAVSSMTSDIAAVTSLPDGGFSSRGSIGDYYYTASSYFRMTYRQNEFGALQGDVNGDGLTDFLVIKPGGPRPSDMDPDNWQQSEIEFSLLLSQGGNGPPRFHQIDLSGWASEFRVNVGGEIMVPIYDRMTQGDFVGTMAFDPGSMEVNERIELWRIFARPSNLENMSLEDMNGDGKADYVWYVHRPRIWDTDPDISGWYVMYSLGTRFSAPQRLNVDWNPGQPINVNWDISSGHYMHAKKPADINGDGLVDQFVMWGTHRDKPQPVDIQLRSSGGRGHLVESITDGVGRKTEIAYKAAKDASIYTKGGPVTYPIREQMASTPVVSDIYKDSGASSPADRQHFSYQYSGNRLDLSGRGALGFHSFVTLDHQTNLFKYQFLTQSFPMTGLTAREQTYRFWETGSGSSAQVNFRQISSHDNTVVFDEVVNGANTAEAYGTVYPFMSKAIESRWENSPTAHFNFSLAGSASAKPELLFSAARPAGAHITISAQSWFDNQPLSGDPLTTLPAPYNPNDRTTDWSLAGTNTVTGIADYATFDALEFPRQITHGNLRQLSTDFGDGFTEKVITTYHAPTTNGLTGLVNTVTTTVSSTSHGTEAAPVKSYTYEILGSTPTTLVKTETLNATDDTLDLTTTYTRDSLGRVTSTEIAGYHNPGHPQHIGTYTTSTVTAFDARFDLPTTSKNAYGHTTTVAYHPFFGTPTSVKDANDAETTTQYDALGRVVQTRDVLKNLQSDTTYAWTTSSATDWTKTQTVSPPTGVTGLSLSSAYAVRTTATVRPATVTYYDRLSRPIRTLKDGFAGQQTVTDTIYNTLGQTVATSLPYKSGTPTGELLWAKTTYDPLGRVVTVTAPNGTVTTTTYKGRLTEVTVDATDRDPQTNATYVDAKGRTIAVWNADNTPSTTLISGSDAAVTAAVSTASIEFRLDGFGRMRETKLKDQTALISATYDAHGRQTALNDPDKGNWSYLNNALGQVVTQTDAKLNVTQSTFDRLARPLTRTTTEPASGPVETARWYYYDTTANVSLYPHLVAQGDQGWIGAPQREEAQTTGASGYAAPLTQKAFYYDAKGRPAITLNSVDGKWFYTHTGYDTYSRPIATHHYWRPPAHELPSDQPYIWQNFGYTYTYDGVGSSSKSYLVTMGDTAGRTWWQADSANGYDHLDRPVLVRKGSGHWTERTYDLDDGTLTALKTGPNPGATGIQDLAFTYDGLGNLASRTAPGLSETFGYDALNRLTNSSISGATTYLGNGNINTKTDINGAASAAYQYGSAKPHAVTSAFGYTMAYDANGNLTTRTGNNTTWSTRWAGFDKPRWLAKTTAGATTGSEFTYDANRSRVLHLEFDALSGGAPSHYTRKKVYGLGPTLEVDYKNTAAGGPPAWQMDKVRIYVPGPEGTAGTMEYSPLAPSDQDERPLVYHYDHLGSIETITPYGSTATTAALDDAGRPSRFAYDAWGDRRNATTWSGAPTTSSQGNPEALTPRGYTGHEMLDGLDLVHMNGRIYDPLLGRMLSADILVQFAGDLQSYNRYSYVLNSPLTRVDPSGYESLVLTSEKTVSVTGILGTHTITLQNRTGSETGTQWTGVNVTSKGHFSDTPSVSTASFRGDTRLTDAVLFIARSDALSKDAAATIVTAFVAAETVKNKNEKPVEQNKPKENSSDGKIDPQNKDDGYEEPSKTTSLYHKGELKDGQVDPNRPLSTGTDKEKVEALTTREGEVHQFDVPKEKLSEWEQEGTAEQRTDHDAQTGTTQKEVRIYPPRSGEMNDYKVPPPPPPPEDPTKKKP